VSNLLAYPPGAGGNFLISLITDGQYTYVENHNEYTTYDHPGMKLMDASQNVFNQYPWYKTHDLNFVQHFTDVIVISSKSQNIQRYCNALAALKIGLNRKPVDVKRRIDRCDHWANFNHYKYIPYEQIFFDLELNNTPWQGYEQQIADYTKRNIELLDEQGYSKIIPKR